MSFCQPKNDCTARRLAEPSPITMPVIPDVCRANEYDSCENMFKDHGCI